MKQNTKSIIIRFAIKLCAFITIAIALTIISYILITGIPELNAGLFAWHYTSENLSMVSSIINTIIIVFLSLLFALPIGVFTALYLTEYAPLKVECLKKNYCKVCLKSVYACLATRYSQGNSFSSIIPCKYIVCIFCHSDL